MDNNDKIANKLNLSPMSSGGKVVEYKQPEMQISTAEKELESDRAYARTNFYQTIESGTLALEQMLEIAQQSMQPRAFEVVATLIKTIIDANKDLVDISTKRVEAEKPKEEVKPQQTTNQLIFNGSTKELMDYLKGKDE